MRAEPLYDLLNPLFCYLFAADVLCKVSAVVVYEKSRCRLISVPFASIFADLNLEVIKKFQACRFPDWKKSSPLAHGNFQNFTQGFFGRIVSVHITTIIIHQTHYQKSDWSRAFNQFTIACELDMINALSAADNTFIMSSSTSAWLLNPSECSPQKQNG